MLTTRPKCYTPLTGFDAVIRGHHVYQTIWSSIKWTKLYASPDKREETQEQDRSAIGVYKDIVRN